MERDDFGFFIPEVNEYRYERKTPKHMDGFDLVEIKQTNNSSTPPFRNVRRRKAFFRMVLKDEIHDFENLLSRTHL